MSLLAVLALSSLIATPLALAQPASGGSIPASPSLSTLTLTDYGGSDQAGVSDLVAGKIQAYDFAVTPTEASTVPSSFNQYESPAAWYGLEVNPTNTTTGFNPFQFQEVRFALNYLAGRSYFSQQLLGGNAIPTFTVYGGEPDQLVTSPATAAFSNITDSVQAANTTIYNTLVANGATFKYASTPQWYFQGKPITVSIFDRTDDPVRHAYAGYLASQLQKVGFATTMITGSLATAETVFYGSDPSNASWDIYPQSYSFTYSYYDEGFGLLYAPIAGAIPASDTNALAFGAFNVTAREQPSTVQLLDAADSYALDFFNTNFSSMAQRNADLNGLVSAGVKAAVVIGIAQSLEPYVTSPSLSGVTTNFVTDPLLNALSFLTMSTGSGTADIGVRHIAQSSLNPVGGYRDAYSVAWSEAVQFPPVFYQPSTGYPYPVGWSFSVKADNSTASTPVPSSAVVMNASSDAFVPVPAGTMAKSVAVANFAPMLQQSWQDGRPLTLADILYQYILAGEVTQDSNSPVYDGTAAAIFGPSWSTVLGFQILNSTSVEVYSTFYYPDAYFAGENVVGALFAFTPTTGAQGMLPWEVYAGMANLVASGKDAWSTSASNTKSLPWLSLVNPTDVSNLESALTSYSSASYVPTEFASLESLTGVRLVTTSSADAGYTAAVSFMEKYGTGIIGNGPYILTQYSASTSPAFVILTKNPAFDWGDQMAPELGVAPTLVSQTAQVPGVMSPGESINVTALQTSEGNGSTAPVAGANVTLQLISNGTIKYQTSASSGQAGLVTFTIPPTMALGPYVVSIWTSTQGSTLYHPLTESVQLTAPTSPASTTSGGAASSSSNPAGASSSDGAAYYMLAVVVIVVAVVAVALFARRRAGP